MLSVLHAVAHRLPCLSLAGVSCSACLGFQPDSFPPNWHCQKCVIRMEVGCRPARAHSTYLRAALCTPVRPVLTALCCALCVCVCVCVPLQCERQTAELQAKRAKLQARQATLMSSGASGKKKKKGGAAAAEP